ncbi:MAG: FAD-binding oxidoreductase [Anaerolineales bacterium]
METAIPNAERARLDEQAFEDLAGRLRGELLRPGVNGYEEARSIWNGMIDKRPGAIARCLETADVVQAVNFARKHQLLVSVRSGGHNVAGDALCDGGLTIDLSAMKDIQVDPEQRTARVQPGVTLGDLDNETQPHGLATSTGIVSDTGLAGLTLGGGFGWLTRKYGFTCDNLLSAEVVTADGRVLTASDEENSDLFWGLRGGGGNFGIVTNFEFQLHPVGPDILSGLVIHRMEDAAEVLRFYREFTADVPKELGTMAVFRLAPPAPFIPEELHGKPILALVVFYAGDLEEGRRVLKPLREFGEPVADRIGVKTYNAHQSMLDEGQPSGKQYYWKSEYVTELPDELIEILIDHSGRLDSPLGRVAVFQLGGAAAEIDDMGMAAGNREAEYIVAINHGWKDPAQNSRQIDWTRRFWKAVQPLATGGPYINFMTADEGQNRVQAAYGKQKYQRLVKIKNRYDPDNFFRLNQNIEPRA